MLSETETEIVAQGRAAWTRIREHERTSFDDWAAAGKALNIGRAQSLRQANTDKPYGKIYMRHMTAWLKETGFDEIRSQERYWALAIADNFDEIIKWRAGLDERQRRRFNHPQAVWKNWNRSRKMAREMSRFDRSTRQRLARPTVQKRMTSFPGQMIRRAADAMRGSRSNDWIVLARVALEAAIRDGRDIADLLPDEPAPKKRTEPHNNELAGAV